MNGRMKTRIARCAEALSRARGVCRMLRSGLPLLPAAALVLLAGCSELGVGHRDQPCNEQDQCLPGLVCNAEKRCVPPGGDGGLDADGDAGVDGGQEDGGQDDGGLDGGQDDGGVDGGQDDGGVDGGQDDGGLDGGQDDGGFDGGQDDGGLDGDDGPAAYVLQPSWSLAWNARGDDTFYGVDDIELHLATLGNGDVIVAGSYDVDFVIDVGLPGQPSGSDIFIVRLPADGGAPPWVSRFGGQMQQRLLALATDDDDNIYLGGAFANRIDFGGDVTLEAIADEDAFVAKLSAEGVVQWAVRWGGPGNQAVTALDATAGDTIYAAGHISGDMELGEGGSSVVCGAGFDAFVVAASAGNGAEIESMTFGGDLHQRARALAVAGDGAVVYLAGDYSGQPTDLAGTGACSGLPYAAASQEKAYVLRLGSGLVDACDWALVVGDAEESGAALVRGVVLDGGGLWVTGEYGGELDVWLPEDSAVASLRAATREDAWLARLAVADGGVDWWAGFGGGSLQRGVALDRVAGLIAWTGTFDETITFGDHTLTTDPNEGDAFLALFDGQAGHSWSRALGGDHSQRGRALAATGDGGLYLAGTSAGDITIGEAVHRGGGLIFVVRLEPPSPRLRRAGPL